MDYRKMMEEELKDPKYNVLRDKAHLPLGMMFCGLGGSHSYGLAGPNSDIDIRCIGFNPLENLFYLKNFQKEVIIENSKEIEIDYAVYYFNKYAEMLISSNPSVLEMIAVPMEKVYITSPEYQLLRDNIDVFLSKRVFYTFGKYAEDQLKKIKMNLYGDVSEIQKERYRLDSVLRQVEDINSKINTTFNLDSEFKIYMNESISDEMLFDFNVQEKPLRSLVSVMSGVDNVLKGYDKLGKRNKKSSETKMEKHCMCLERLLTQAEEILKGEGVQVDRTNIDKEWLMSIKNGEVPVADVLAKIDQRVENLKKVREESELKESLNMEEVKEIFMEINKMHIERYYNVKL